MLNVLTYVWIFTGHLALKLWEFSIPVFFQALAHADNLGRIDEWYTK